MSNYEIIKKCEQNLKEQFEYLDEIAYFNQKKVLDAFRKNNIETRHFAGTTGYGYSDIGRETLAKLYSDVFGTEKSLVSPLITCATQALTMTLFGLLRPNDLLMSVTGGVYDTMYENILGKPNEDIGSLKDFGVKYEEVPLKDNHIDTENVLKKVQEKQPKVVLLQRSRGYSSRAAFSAEELGELIQQLKKLSPNSIFMVDNCYGEFTEKYEVTEFGADIIVGSLIKNPGGGLAQTGAYVSGKTKYVELVEKRFTCPSLGTETGSFEQGYRMFYQGLFMAPHTVIQALKGAYLVGEIMKLKGYEINPESNQKSFDIIKSVTFNTADELIKFVQLVQKNSPIDSNAVPLPWDMPGYPDQVIMAAGTFVSGASIELSCDSPIRAPYIAYFQGGLTYEHIKCLCDDLLNNY